MKLIRGGTVVNANHTARYEVLIAGEKIAAPVSYTHLTLPTKA